MVYNYTPQALGINNEIHWDTAQTSPPHSHVLLLRPPAARPLATTKRKRNREGPETERKATCGRLQHQPRKTCFELNLHNHAPLSTPFCLGMPVLPTLLLNSHSTFCLSHSCVSVSHNNTSRLWCWQSRGFPRAVWLVLETCSEMCENLYVGLFSSNLGTYYSQKLDKANKSSHCCVNWLLWESLILRK